MMRLLPWLRGDWLVLPALICVSLIWGYAVLHFGGIPKPQWNLCVLALGTLAIVCALLLRPVESMTPLGPLLTWPLILLPCYVTLQVVPLPLTLVRVLSPARAALSSALARVMGAAATTTLSANADATCEHLLRLLSYILVFLLIRHIATRLQVSRWITALPIVAMAVIEAVIGIVQYTADPARNVAHGTYANRNHFAGLLEMAFPFAIMFPASLLIRSGLAASGASPKRPLTGVRGSVDSADYRAATVTERFCHGLLGDTRTVAKVVLGCAASLIILIGIIQSLSRTGFVAAFFSLVVMSLLTLRHDLAGRARIGLLSGAGLLVLLSVAMFPPGRLVARFGALATYGGLDSGIDRRMIWEQSMRVIADYALVGCGLGGYEFIWTKYKTELPLWATDFVHNDYIQLLAELGIAGFVIVTALSVAILIRTMRAMALTAPAGSRHLAIACAGAMAAILLHSMDDFNLYIPANAMLLAWIAGIVSTLPHGEGTL